MAVVDVKQGDDLPVDFNVFVLCEFVKGLLESRLVLQDAHHLISLDILRGEFGQKVRCDISQFDQKLQKLLEELLELNDLVYSRCDDGVLKAAQSVR